MIPLSPRVTTVQSPRTRAGLAVVLALILSLSAVIAPLVSARSTPPAEGWDLAATGISFEEIATGLSNPLAVVSPPDDPRLFVVEQTGTVRVVADGALAPEPFIDVSDRITTSGLEQGLLGLAFDPDYATNGVFYLYYTDTGGTVTVSRFNVTGDPAVADPASEAVLLAQDKRFQNHNGGAILFGPDGFLYLGLGDGGSAGDPNGNGQNLGTWLGKVLRIDPDPAATAAPYYAVPDSNPFVDRAGALPEIWAYGLRNPWRISFDRETGDLWVADVGQALWEEIDFQPADSTGGENYGWVIREGAHCYAAETCATEGLVDPVLEYDHSFGASVTGGYVYRGMSAPDLAGVYLYGDFATGLLWGALPGDDGTFVASAPIETGFLISSFGEGSDGEVYLTLFGQQGDGSLVKVKGS